MEKTCDFWLYIRGTYYAKKNHLGNEVVFSLIVVTFKIFPCSWFL